MKTLEQHYLERYESVLKPVAKALEELLHAWLENCPRIDRISARAKDPERFLKKAGKKIGEALAYQNPLEDIQDQVGARVTVLYLSDVPRVSDDVERYLRPREVKVKAPDRDEEFSYFGKHFILELPADAIPREIERDEAPEVFELQIKTLCQHAWSESNHDLGYKPHVSELTSEQRRLLAYSSAQAWGADRVFDELHQALNSLVHRN